MHSGFIAFADTLLPDGTPRNLFRRMVRQSAISHRYSFLDLVVSADGSVYDADSFFVRGNLPTTARRMQAFEQFAPRLAKSTLDKLALTEERCV